MGSLNPFKYKPSQIAKALMALLTSVIGALGLAASVFADGPLVVVGQWSVAAALFLAPILVFLQKAAPLFGMLDGLRASDPAAAGVQYRDDADSRTRDQE